MALQREGYEMCIHDQRVPIEPGCEYGYVINTQYRGVCRSVLECLGCSGHWFLIKKVDEDYYIFDSSRKQPKRLDGVIKGHLEEYRQEEAFIWKIVKHQVPVMTEMMEIRSSRQQNNPDK